MLPQGMLENNDACHMGADGIHLGSRAVSALEGSLSVSRHGARCALGLICIYEN